MNNTDRPTLSDKLDSIFRKFGANPLEAKVYGDTFMTYWGTEKEALDAVLLFVRAGLAGVKSFESGGRFIASGYLA